MDWGRIFKTGAVAGVIYGILQGIVSVLTFVFYREQIIELMRSSIPSNVEIPLSMEQLADIGMISAIPGSIIGGIIAGIIVCFIFTLMYNELLGKDSKRKGLFLCILLLIGIGLGELAYPGVIGGIFMVQTRYIMLTPLNVVFFLVFGYLLGNFYNKFGQKERR
ncbi:MAG: hypothetical protein KAT94_03325 [Candidatus Aenigmarchaeota archaeon]|nr:hypothetical protein [Candidatus Aenigmarchaeota archaeon]MCK4531873.1 hypothetical protein [Candidatus Aenigmarchaeota archaeon]